VRRSRNRSIVLAAALALLGLPAQAGAQDRPVPPSAADVARAWVRDWSRGDEAAVCSRVAQPLLLQLALASGTSACSGAVASALNGRTPDVWRGASILRMRVRLLDDTLAVATFRLRHELLVNGQRSAPVMPDRIYLSRPDARVGRPWRVASLGVTPFVASGASQIALDPSTLDPPGVRSGLDEPVAPGRLRPACTGRGVSVSDAIGDVRREEPPPRAAGQLLPHHPRGDEFGTILARRPWAFAGRRTSEPALDLTTLTMHREDDGHVCLQVRFARAPRPDSRLLVRWFEPVPGSETEGASGSVELRFDGRGGLHFWFDRLASTVADPDLATRFASRRPEVGRSGAVVSIRLSSEDMRRPERFRIALRTASSTASDPAGVPVVAAGDTLGGDTTGAEWPGGGAGPLFDPGTGPA
jgi:hypothetical protein